MSKEELIEGEIYYCEGWGDSYLFEVTNKKDNNTHLGFKRKEISHSGWDFWTSSVITNLRKATKEECHQLQCSIKANKFIDYNTSMKTFNNSLIGRYLKYIGNSQSLPKYGDYFQIKVEESGNNLLRLSDNVSNCHWTYEEVKNKTSKHFELMPIDFIPEQQTNIMEEKKTEFKKGDYIVVVSGRKGYTHVSDNFCYKQSKNKSYLIPELCNIGSRDSNASGVDFNNEEDKWRYATKEEIAEYDRIGKPYDVTTLKPIKEWSVGSYVVITGDYHSTKIGEVHKICKDSEIGFYVSIHESVGVPCAPYKDKVKWFPTLQEAEIFSKNMTMKEEKWIPKVGDWIYLLKGCGGRGMLSNDEGKVAKIKEVKNGYLYLDDKSNKFRTTGNISVREQYVRKALPHEIPQENNNSIVDIFVIGKKLSEINFPDKHLTCYKDSEGKKQLTFTGSNYNFKNNYGDRKITNVSKDYFEVSGFSYGWFKKSDVINNIEQHPLTTNNSNMEVEVGDTIEFLKNFDAKPKGFKTVVSKITSEEFMEYNNSHWISYAEGGFRLNGNGYTLNQDFKIIKKAQTTNSIKKVDCVSPTKVNTNITVKQAVKLTSNVIINVKPISSNVRVQINEQKYQAKKVIISKTTIKI